MKTLFFGTSAFAVPSLEATAARTELQAVVTQPDRPAHRGHTLQPPPVKTAAERLGLRVLQPPALRGLAKELRDAEYDFFVLASYGKLIPKELLELPKMGALNVHPSLLPKYRGATPIQSALRDGATETGVTIMFMDEGLDTGDVVLQERMPVLPEETYGELHDRLARFGAMTLEHAIASAHDGVFPREPQRGEPSLTRPLRKEDLAIDWTWDAPRIVNYVRALAPAPAARAAIAGTSVKILRAQIAPWSLPLAEPGKIGGMHGEGVIVRCGGNGAVNVLRLIAPNRAPQTGAQFAAMVLPARHDGA